MVICGHIKEARRIMPLNGYRDPAWQDRLRLESRPPSAPHWGKARTPICCQFSASGQWWWGYSGSLVLLVPFHSLERPPNDATGAVPPSSRSSPACGPRSLFPWLLGVASEGIPRLCPKSAPTPEALWLTVGVASLSAGLEGWHQCSWVDCTGLGTRESETTTGL